MPMSPDPRFTLRAATPADRNAVSLLMRYEPYVHSHLDWRPADEWLGAQPYLMLERGRRAIGVLAAPPDPPNTAWLRLFAVVADASPAAVWDQLWPPTRDELVRRGVRIAAALSAEPWFGSICARAGFHETHGVIVLERHRGPLATAAGTSVAAIREASRADYETVYATDLSAFTPPWQMSAEVIGQAVALADFITVAEVEGQIVGYQLTTPSNQGAHLARLAVLPSWQGFGIGTSLVRHLIEHYNHRRAGLLTVNTQDTNVASLAVYEGLGFTRTGVRFPVNQLALTS
jgi:ribosomal protein S18 acetylase RimI-like enzyme